MCTSRSETAFISSIRVDLNTHPSLPCIAVAPRHLCSNTTSNTDVLMWMGKCLQKNCWVHLTVTDMQFGVRFPTEILQTLQSEEDI